MIKEYIGLKITDDIEEYRSENSYNPEIEEALNACYKISKKGKANGLNKILKFVKKYKNNPQFLGYLITYYETIGQLEKAMDYGEILIERFPNYLFGRTHLAKIYLDAEY
jgi:lipopolysaccharide biosynthesis regulator YciM